MMSVTGAFERQSYDKRVASFSNREAIDSETGTQNQRVNMYARLGVAYLDVTLRRTSTMPPSTLLDGGTFLLWLWLFDRRAQQGLHVS